MSTATTLTRATTMDLTLSTDAGATLTCALDGSPYTPCATPVALSGLTWIDWHIADQRPFSDPERVLSRVQRILTRLEHLAEGCRVHGR